MFSAATRRTTTTQQQQHNNNKNRSTAQSNEHPLPSVAFSLPCRIRRLLRLKLLLTPLYSQLRRRPHVLPEVVVVVATAAASAAVVAVALMPFFSLDFLHDFCLCWPPAVPSSCPLPLSSTYPLCPALPHVKCLHRIICTSQVSA